MPTTTQALLQVAAALLARPDDRQWIYDLGQQAGVSADELHSLLAELLDAGWLADGWEDPEDVVVERRAPRRYYQLTDRGRAELDAIMRAAPSD